MGVNQPPLQRRCANLKMNFMTPLHPDWGTRGTQDAKDANLGSFGYRGLLTLHFLQHESMSATHGKGYDIDALIRLAV